LLKGGMRGCSNSFYGKEKRRKSFREIGLGKPEVKWNRKAHSEGISPRHNAVHKGFLINTCFVVVEKIEREE